MKKEKPTMRERYVQSVREQIRENKVAFIWYSVLRGLVIAAMIRAIFLGNYEEVFLCALSLVLFLLPSLLEKTLKIELPTTLEIIVYCFIFAAEILGEIENFYVRIAGWDTILHTVWGFLCAAIGFALVDIINQSPKFKFDLSPLFLAIVAFCFSMTIGVLWEFFEFSMDQFFTMDMQKDFIIRNFASVTLDPTQSNIPIHVQNIIQTQIILEDGSIVTIEGGYLDIGIIDTMKDLFVNFIGAVIFSIIGFFYVRDRGTGTIARQFIPVLAEDEPRPAEEGQASEQTTETDKREEDTTAHMQDVATESELRQTEPCLEEKLQAEPSRQAEPLQETARSRGKASAKADARSAGRKETSRLSPRPRKRRTERSGVQTAETAVNTETKEECSAEDNDAEGTGV